MKDLRCLVGFHRFVAHHVEGGHGTYQECSRCKKVDDSFDPKGKGVITTFGFGG